LINSGRVPTSVKTFSVERWDSCSIFKSILSFDAYAKEHDAVA